MVGPPSIHYNCEPEIYFASLGSDAQFGKPKWLRPVFNELSRSILGPIRGGWGDRLTWPGGSRSVGQMVTDV